MGPPPSPSRCRVAVCSEAGSVAAGASKAICTVLRQARCGRSGTKMRAASPSTATITLRACAMPSAVRSVQPSPSRAMADTGVRSRTLDGGSGSASSAGNAPMPCAGMAAPDRANMMNRNSSAPASMPSERSRNTPPKNGRMKRSMKCRPAPSRCSMCSALSPRRQGSVGVGCSMAGTSRFSMKRSAPRPATPPSNALSGASGTSSGWPTCTKRRPVHTCAWRGSAHRFNFCRSIHSPVSGYAGRCT